MEKKHVLAIMGLKYCLSSWYFVWLAVVTINNRKISDSKEVPLDIV